MPKKIKAESAHEAAARETSDDEYEETIVVADLNGVLDVESVSKAFTNRNISLRFANTDKPLVQVGQAVFAGEWNQTLGSDMIFIPKAKSNDQEQKYEFLAASATRLSTNKAIVSCTNEHKEQ
ncbi:unnamed protein product [Bursaphelenchus xylophilus]|uniref:(pine wood nematode) hypothetical protein n=1 Tax=Bursaphelenchus xylophilus TaxID=6326 RepID=A0A1I7RY04_BURXY|nr:unnamed protein product [Bursaphelenchus xylophilus]CAG9085150.1 unnamed protein product [Bursaphelenchus xylophilus]